MSAIPVDVDDRVHGQVLSPPIGWLLALEPGAQLLVARHLFAQVGEGAVSRELIDQLCKIAVIAAVAVDGEGSSDGELVMEGGSLGRGSGSYECGA